MSSKSSAASSKTFRSASPMPTTLPPCPAGTRTWVEAGRGAARPLTQPRRRPAPAPGEVPARAAGTGQLLRSPAGELLTGRGARLMFRETAFDNVEHVSDLNSPYISPRGGEEPRPPCFGRCAVGEPHGSTTDYCPEAHRRIPRDRFTRLRRGRLGRRHRRDRGWHQGPLLNGPAWDHLVRVHARHRRRGVRDRAHLRRPHQSRGHAGPRGVRQVLLARGARVCRGPGGGGGSRGRGHLPHPGQAGHDRSRWRGDLLQPRHDGFRAGHGDRGDRHVHAGLRHLRRHRPPCGARLGADGDRRHRVRGHHHRGPGHRRRHQPGPLPGRGVHAEGVRRERAVVATARLSHRGTGRRGARWAHLGSRGQDPQRRIVRQPGPSRAGSSSGRGRPGRRENPGRHVMKKLINSPDSVVTDALAGVAAAHPSLAVDIENKVITRAGGPRAGKVGLVSGGGSGHEPLHGGFVGYGMLDAACPGEVFTSPVPDQMLAATRAVNGGAGVLHIVKNYTGDVLNFQMAAELADDDGIVVVPVIINDDVAVEDSLYTAGRRGVGATVFVEKIAGALAERGAPLADVAAVAAKVNERSRSFGVALTSCTIPAAGKPTFELGDGEIELGIGIHGEPGRRRAPLAPAAELAAAVMDAIHADQPLAGDLLVMVNGMGGTPLIELYLVYNEVHKYVTGKGARITRNLVGNYITSLEMQGFSVTVCRLTDALGQLWDAPVDTPALRWGR